MHPATRHTAGAESGGVTCRALRRSCGEMRWSRGEMRRSCDETRRSCRAFTMPELVLGLLITSFVGVALTSFMSAVTGVWASDAAGQSLNLTSNATTLRLQRALSTAKYIGAWQSGSLTSSADAQALVFYWARDDWNGSADRTVQIGELALVEFDRADQVLRQYQSIDEAQMTVAQRTAASGVMTYVELISSTAPQTFKQLSFVNAKVIGRNISGAKFNVFGATGTTELPSMDFQLQFETPQKSELELGTATVQSPTTQPN